MKCYRGRNTKRENARKEWKQLGERRGEKRGIGLGKLDAIRRMQRKGLSMEDIMDMGYTMDEYKQALQTENQLIEK